MADAGIVTADVTVWADAGSELPADPAGVVTVGVASLADAGKVTVGVADLAVAGVASLADFGMVSPADAGKMFPAVSAERVTMNVTNLTEEVHVNVVGVQTCTSWGDRLSPGVWCQDRSLINKNVACRPDDLLRGDWNDTDSSVLVGAPESLMCDPGCPVTDDMSYWERLEVLGDDSYGYDDDLNGQAGYFDYYDPRDYEEWCDWNDADAAEGYYHPDRLHGEGGFVYFKDAFGLDMDSVVVSSVMCAAEPAERHSSDVSGPRSDSVLFEDEVDELNLQCIDIDGLGEAPGRLVLEF